MAALRHLPRTLASACSNAALGTVSCANSTRRGATQPDRPAEILGIDAPAALPDLDDPLPRKLDRYPANARHEIAPILAPQFSGDLRGAAGCVGRAPAHAIHDPPADDPIGDTHAGEPASSVSSATIWRRASARISGGWAPEMR